MAQKVLGIDPGLTRCGFGLITSDKSRSVKFLEVGVFTTKPDLELSERLYLIGLEIEKLLDRVKPDRVAVERVFSQQNLKTVMSIASISGIVSYLCSVRGIKVDYYTPTEVKAAVTGSGRAKKDQVGNMVVKILKLKELPKPADAADALAVAITASWRSGTSEEKSEQTPAQIKWRAAEAASKKRAR
ncbi:MAG: crossover junction endodeoxyribonuclease RuvC [Micrococcales bacterium]|nr:crossover junction endodeoxyribonuclease RuvC [Micrococcales bacterium]